MRAILKTPMGAIAAALLTLLAATAVVAPTVWGAAAETMDTSQMLTLPSAKHWIGTDQLGRDLLARTIVATRLALVLALAATAVGVVVGMVLGVAPSLLGRRLGGLITAVVNIAVAFPGLLLALFFAAVFGVGQVGAVLAIGLAGAPGFARLVQTLVAGVTRRDFIAAARIAGQPKWLVSIRHVLPNIAEPIVVNATMGAGSALLAFAGLSFIGLGVQPPAYDWGRLMNENLERVYLNPLAALVPGLAVVVAGLAFNLAGEAIAAAFRLDTTRPRALSRSKAQARQAGAPASSPQPDADRLRDAPTDEDVLQVRGLEITFPGGGSPVRGVDLRVGRGEALGVVGESGAGKSLTGLAIAQLIESPGEVRGSVVFMGQDLTDGRDHRRLLGTSLALVFQDPNSTFNPVRRMGWQLAEVALTHQGLARRAAFSRAVDRLGAVRIPAPRQRAHQYPHEFSGGMRQRAMIGMGLMAQPTLIIADEPTTALDMTVQRQVLDLIDAIRERDDVALLLISHDVTVVSERCDRVAVMYAGKVVEELATRDLGQARHPYTRLLVAAVPDLRTDLTAPLAVIPGHQPDPPEVPPGCAFAPRCPLADARCRADEPTLGSDGVACWHPGEPFPVPQEGVE
ncbi:MAG: dipeptide/oligopeptide/nickel ABC transporter permease/ATP-binding protein [Bifidobacteriaceae bacterium]|jgi:oligopeptide/dipeptide ABC transporter ATP-binding protein|nr:dipeptide/oligopeptide/nickel ABC transporter permease/ATP-binding protein [Bifidobacteriaceae bacterium]